MRVLPPGAKRIWDLRLAGQKPTDLLIVSTVGAINSGNHQIFVDHRKPSTFEWRWVFDLPILLVHDSALDASLVRDYVAEIIRYRPRTEGSTPSPLHGSMCTWNTSLQDGAEWSWWAGITPLDPDIEPMDEELTSWRLGVLDRKAWEGIDRA